MPVVYFPAFEGMRVIACFAIVLLHWRLALTFIFDNLEEIPSSLPSRLCSILSPFVESFFLLSSFLLASKYFTTSASVSRMIVERIVRLWPVMIIACLFNSLVYRDGFNYLSQFSFLQAFPIHFLIFPQLVALNLGLSPFWSVSADFLMMLMLLPILKKWYPRAKPLATYSVIPLVIATTIPIILRVLLANSAPCSLFEANQGSAGHFGYSIARSAVGDPLIAEKSELSFLSLFPKQNISKIFEVARQDPNLIAASGCGYGLMYMNPVLRFYSFGLGALLFLLVERQKRKVEESKKEETKQFIGSFLIGFFGFCLMVIPTYLAPSTLDQQIIGVHPTIPIPSGFTKLFVDSLELPLFCFGNFLLLFSVLVPDNHGFHWSFAYRFLSAKIWTPIASLTYGVYCLHYIVLHAFLYLPNSPFFLKEPRQLLENWYWHVWALFFILFTFSLFLAALVHKFLEPPLLSALQFLFLQKKIKTV